MYILSILQREWERGEVEEQEEVKGHWCMEIVLRGNVKLVAEISSGMRHLD